MASRDYWKEPQWQAVPPFERLRSDDVYRWEPLDGSGEGFEGTVNDVRGRLNSRIFDDGGQPEWDSYLGTLTTEADNKSYILDDDCDDHSLVVKGIDKTGQPISHGFKAEAVRSFDFQIEEQPRVDWAMLFDSKGNRIAEGDDIENFTISLDYHEPSLEIKEFSGTIGNLQDYLTENSYDVIVDCAGQKNKADNGKHTPETVNELHGGVIGCNSSIKQPRGGDVPAGTVDYGVMVAAVSAHQLTLSNGHKLLFGISRDACQAAPPIELEWDPDSLESLR